MKAPISNTNPYWIKRCCHLDDEGTQCRGHKNLTLCRYHSDREIHAGKTEWAVIALCEKHFKPYLEPTPRHRDDAQKEE